MNTLLVYLLVSYLALSVQAVFFSGIKPDLVLILVCAYALKYGHARGTVYGILSGLLIDTMSGFVLGPQMISKSLTGFLIGSLKDHLFQWNLFVNTLAVAVFAVINLLCVYAIYETFSSVSFVNRSLEISFMEILYTVIAALVLYPAIRRVRGEEPSV